jgi:hypothetical protein
MLSNSILFIHSFGTSFDIILHTDINFPRLVSNHLLRNIVHYLEFLLGSTQTWQSKRDEFQKELNLIILKWISSELLSFVLGYKLINLSSYNRCKLENLLINLENQKGMIGNSSALVLGMAFKFFTS